MKRFAAFVVCLLLVAPFSHAAAGNASASIWRISGDEVVLRYTFPEPLAALLATPGTPSPSVEMIARYVLSRVSVQRQGEACEALDQGYDLGRIDTLYAGPGLFSFEVLFRCRGKAGTLVLRNNTFFERSPGLIDIANIRVTGTAAVFRLITADDTAVSIQAGRAPEPSSPGAYVGLGLRHVLTSIVCLFTASGLLLLLRNRRELVTVGCGLFAGYLIAALAAGAGGWMLQPQPSQVFEGFLVILLGALLTTRTSTHPNVVAAGLATLVGVVAAAVALLGYGTAALCLVGAGIFGTLSVPLYGKEDVARWLLLMLGSVVAAVDGFSLASRLAPLHSIISIGAAQLLAYNMGALLGTLAVFATVAAARAGLRRFAGLSTTPLYTDLLTASFTGLGIFAMLQTS